jgi:hypothetical protein
MTHTEPLSLRAEPQEPLERPLLASCGVENGSHGVRVTGLGVVKGGNPTNAFVKRCGRCRNET